MSYTLYRERSFASGMTTSWVGLWEAMKLNQQERSERNKETAPVPTGRSPKPQCEPVPGVVLTIPASPVAGEVRYWRHSGPQIPLREGTLSNATTVVVECSRRPVCQDSSLQNPVCCLLVGPLQLNGQFCLVQHGRDVIEESTVVRVAPVMWSHPFHAISEGASKSVNPIPYTYISRGRPGIPRPDAKNRFQIKQMSPGTMTARETVFTGSTNAQEAVCDVMLMPGARHSVTVSWNTGVPV
jgi:hypothetical protein